jgi:hypothetical protein
MTYYSVLCGEVLRCIKSDSPEHAAELALCEAFLCSDDGLAELADVVEVVSEHGEKSEFSTESTMIAAGGIKRVVPERIAEKFDLPDDVLEFYDQAFTKEVLHHVRDVFGCEVQFEDVEEFKHRVVHEHSHGSRDSMREAACRAFAWIAAQWSDEALSYHGLTRSRLEEWKPADTGGD